MNKFVVSVFAVLLLCSSAFPVAPITKTLTEMGYTTTYSVDVYDSTTECATKICLKDLPTAAPAQGFKQVEASKSGVDIYGLGWDGYIYHLNTSPMTLSPPLPASWVQMTSLGHTNIYAIAVQDSSTIFALGGLNGCTGGGRTVMKANAALTGWNNTNPVHCSTSLQVSSDGTLASIDASVGSFTYRLPGVTTWAQASGTGFNMSAAVTSSSIAYGIKSGGSYPNPTLFQVDLASGQAAAIAVNVPPGSFLTLPWTVSVDSSNNLWIASTQGELWHQGRPMNSALGATGPVWNGFYGRPTTTSMVGSANFNFVLSGTTISHLNTVGLSMSFSVNGAYPSCPGGVNCGTARHTITTHMGFKSGGLHPGGVAYQVSGTVLQNLILNASETSTDCDPFEPDDACVIVTFDADLNCSVMGLLFNQPGFFGNYFQPAYTRFISNGNKTCVLDPRSGKNFCSYSITDYCTVATTPPTMNANTIQNAEDVQGFPVFFDVFGACFRLTTDMPWICRGLNAFPTRVNSFPRGSCTKLD